ncbi:MAG: alanine--glyoxylate aminotransferase family protein [Bacteroidia bacterium]|nr:alanine--glyoxylate aminotransferase family protein [Bacteroidia bacterium]
MNTIYFTPGPSQLYPTVGEHIRVALEQQIPSISHRSKAFESLYRETEVNLRTLLDIPEDYVLFFASSATEIWERIGQNCVHNSSFHLVNGSFSERFYTIVQELGKSPLKIEVANGMGWDGEEVEVPEEAELIATVLNETSTGVKTTSLNIMSLATRYPEKLIAVDGVSAFPVMELNFLGADLTYFSVQKGFGLPAGLAVLVVSPRALARAEEIQAMGLSIGSYHNFPSWLEKAKKNQTPETPNVLGIYLLGKVAGDMLAKGMAKIKAEANIKALTLYSMFEVTGALEPFVEEEDWRSKTVAVAKVAGGNEKLLEYLAGYGMVIGDGYGSNKKDHIRISSFPATTVEQITQLAYRIRRFYD